MGTVNGQSILGSGNLVVTAEVGDIYIADVIGLQTALDAKADLSHMHGISSVAGLQAALDGKASTSHSHSISDVTGLQTALDSKASTAVATTSVNGLMSATDKTKLDGIASNANNYVHPTGDGNSHVPATGTTNNGKVLMAGATANSSSWQYLAISNVTGLQSALDAKQEVLTSGSNIKTVNGQSILGSGNLVVTA